MAEVPISVTAKDPSARQFHIAPACCHDQYEKENVELPVKQVALERETERQNQGDAAV